MATFPGCLHNCNITPVDTKLHKKPILKGKYTPVSSNHSKYTEKRTVKAPCDRILSHVKGIFPGEKRLGKYNNCLLYTSRCV